MMKKFTKLLSLLTVLAVMMFGMNVVAFAAADAADDDADAEITADAPADDAGDDETEGEIEGEPEAPATTSSGTGNPDTGANAPIAMVGTAVAALAVAGIASKKSK